jgi:hypothetical protein
MTGRLLLTARSVGCWGCFGRFGRLKRYRHRILFGARNASAAGNVAPTPHRARDFFDDLIRVRGLDAKVRCDVTRELEAECVVGFRDVERQAIAIRNRIKVICRRQRSTFFFE